MQFSGAVLDELVADQRRIVIVGASGWIGKATLTMLHSALGPEETARRVRCFGSRDQRLDVHPGLSFAQRALEELPALEKAPTILFNLAFLTKDKVGAMDDDIYVNVNRSLSEQVMRALEPIGVDRLFVASSGAAAFADDANAAPDLRLYGGLKRDDEERFAAWAEAEPDHRRVVITRIYNISGPFINKYGTYALAAFIIDALAGQPIRVHAPMRVIRGYVAVRELLSVVFAALLSDGVDPVLRFSTGGEPLELGDLAAKVADALGGGVVDRAPITRDVDNCYVGSDTAYRCLLEGFGIDHIPLFQQIVETADYMARADQWRPVDFQPLINE